MASSSLILAEGRALVNRSAACATPGQYTRMICPDSYGSFRYFARTLRCRVLQDPWPMAIASADWDQHAKSYQTVTQKSLSMASADWSATTASSPATSSDSAVLRVTNACLADRQQTREPYRKTTQPGSCPKYTHTLQGLKTVDVAASLMLEMFRLFKPVIPRKCLNGLNVSQQAIV